MPPLSLGVPSTLRLMSLGARSGTDTLCRVPSTGVSQALTLLLDALLTGLVMSPLLSAGRLLSAFYCCAELLQVILRKLYILNANQQRPDCSPGFRQF